MQMALSCKLKARINKELGIKMLLEKTSIKIIKFL